MSRVKCLAVLLALTCAAGVARPSWPCVSWAGWPCHVVLGQIAPSAWWKNEIVFPDDPFAVAGTSSNDPGWVQAGDRFEAVTGKTTYLLDFEYKKDASRQNGSPRIIK